MGLKPKKKVKKEEDPFAYENKAVQINNTKDIYELLWGKLRELITNRLIN